MALPVLFRYMNKTVQVVGSIIVIALIAVFALWMLQGNSSLFANNPNATSTPVGGDGTTPNAPVTETPGKPVATTNATVAPTDTTIVVTGTVNPMGAITTYWYEYGTTANLGQKTSAQTVGSGFSALKTPGYITGLTKNTTYYFRLVASNQYGQSVGAQSSVKTTEGVAAPVGSAPTVKTITTTNISGTSANLSGQVNPNRSATQYWFEYGTDGQLGRVTPMVSVGDGSANAAGSATVGDLQPGTTYYYRMNAQNQFGTVNGAILTFKTSGTASTAASAPVVTTQLPSDVATTTATFQGTVNPRGVATTYWFEYSTDSLLGSVLPKTTSKKSAGKGDGTVTVSMDVTKLSANTTYNVRIVAQSAAGTVRGSIETFKTK